ncbi:hypothetical protein AMS68_002463 [Peltaster fructicola]|uniref:Transcription initiation factor TFIID subunit 1 histone acetyltransferase domain-containing protein n=1 Tax=Peltaster fructicola TaxID=286661 RepID=A0A6H0XQH9_9PEZI|nr:hypothetical protein AMS68_002463 [Peltaster fructicola]
MPDQEKSFKTATIAGAAVQDGYRGRSLVVVEDSAADSNESDMDIDNELDDEETIGGVTMRDLAIICQDWDIPDQASPPLPAHNDSDYEAADRARPQKKTKLAHDIYASHYSAASLRLDEPEHAAAKVAKTVMLDMNDPFLLLDEQAPQNKRKRNANGSSQAASSFRNLARRYNISNDEAYDLLKENHQHKVRSTLGSMAIEHSLPAARLQFPFYAVTLNGEQKRAFHRPRFHIKDAFNKVWRVSKARYQKKKHVRGREAKDLFAKAKNLSLGDNSSLLMLEYSEEDPTALSNFGMGNRILNYYRKRDADDQERPKKEIGEAHVLLGQDKSPFANFGHVDPGETVPTIQNGLYRAPIFQHEPKSTDFVIAVNHTYEGGYKFFLRNAENLHVVGQQLPVAEVPGEHSRKVTDAAKRRLRAISYRIYSKTIDPVRRGVPLTNKVLMKHIPGSDIPQTRSKMREFMKYEKKAKNSEDDGYWVPMPGQAVPDAETIRGWIRPEDICLLDSTQVGVQHLHDLSISTSKNEEENEEEELEEGAHIEKQLAPWQTTKNFIAATQGKAMLALHGEGDPTGRGEGFSFIRTSMKGGYVAEGESVEEKLSERKRKEQGGHKYNVATQQAKYDSSIRTIWNRQKASLSNDNEMSESELDDDVAAGEDASRYGAAGTPRTGFGTPMATGFDDSASQFSKQSVEHGDEVLIIRRKELDSIGEMVETTVRIDNPKIIRMYRRRKQEMKLSKISHRELKPTGDAELDALAQQEIKKELARLERNADRRIAREKLKGRIAAVASGSVDTVAAAAANAGSPSNADSAGSDAEGSKTSTPLKTGKGRSKDGTARKCANCGQVGHIKTNESQSTPCPSLSFALHVRTTTLGRFDQVGFRQSAQIRQ